MRVKIVFHLAQRFLTFSSKRGVELQCLRLCGGLKLSNTKCAFKHLDIKRRTHVFLILSFSPLDIIIQI